MSGLLAAYRLQEAGVPYVVLEKNEAPGGTWFENTYPGCRVDVPSHLYRYSFADEDCEHHYSAQPDVLSGFHRFAEEHGVLDHVRFGTEVDQATFDETTSRWHLEVRTPSGDRGADRGRCRHQCGRPAQPTFVPEDSRPRPLWGTGVYSAQWDHDVPLAGAHVAVIGTGASALSSPPTSPQQAGHLTIFQRTPPWLMPTPEFQQPVEPGLRWLLENVPTYWRWYRFYLLHTVSDSSSPSPRSTPTGRPRTGR